MLSALIVAAGSSQRMGFDKLFADLNGKPVVAHGIQAFEDCPAVDDILIVTREGRESEFAELVRQQGWKKVKAVLPGGKMRHFSVWNGLVALAASGTAPDFVAVHDGARPLVTQEMIARCIARAEETGAACCASPVSDTLKRVDALGCVHASVDRTHLWAMQTPQIFAFPLLYEAYQAIIDAAETVTDEASAVQNYGRSVALVDAGAGFNLKVTYPRDLEIARRLLG
jgi:2-C-methyl-D-erythritol 4-phosphate cytidylyltransferase